MSGEPIDGAAAAALLARWSAGELDADGRARLVAALADRATAAALVEELRLDGLLHEALRVRTATIARRTGVRRRATAFACAAAACAAIGIGWWLLGAATIGRLERADGAVTVLRRGHAVAGPSLRDGDEIVVGATGAAALRLVDGSELAIAAGGDLTLRAAGAAVVGDLARGSVAAVVMPRPADGPLRLRTASAIATVIGTRLRVALDGDATTLEVDEGHVRLERRADASAVVVGPGEVATAAPGRPLVAEPRFDGPLRITAGGTYRGAWRSTDPAVPVLTIATSDPVVIERSSLRGAGHLVRVDAPRADVIVRDCRAVGIAPTRRGDTQGSFFVGGGLARALIEHNDVTGTTGIFVTDLVPGAAAPLVVRANRFRDLDSRASDGAGGWLHDGPQAQANAVSLHRSPAVAGVEIAWNEVDDAPGRSLVGALIDLWKAGGTAASPVLIHDNALRGAYYDPAYDQRFVGSGIMVGEGGELAGISPGHVVIADNQLIATVGGGISVLGGHDHEIRGNRAIASGLLPSGERIPFQGPGIRIEDRDGGHRRAPSTFFANVAHDNLSGWVRWNADGSPTRVDYALRVDADGFHHADPRSTRNESLPTATLADELAEWRRWHDKVRDRGETIGPRP